jgi:hypothetical protein
MRTGEMADLFTDGTPSDDEDSAKRDQMHQCGNCGLRLIGELDKCPECGHSLNERLTLARFDLWVIVIVLITVLLFFAFT